MYITSWGRWGWEICILEKALSLKPRELGSSVLLLVPLLIGCDTPSLPPNCIVQSKT
jgi:hypothetical protein